MKKYIKKNMGLMDNGQTSFVKGILEFSDQQVPGLSFAIQLIVNDVLIKHGIPPAW